MYDPKTSQALATQPRPSFPSWTSLLNDIWALWEEEKTEELPAANPAELSGEFQPDWVAPLARTLTGVS